MAAVIVEYVGSRETTIGPGTGGVRLQYRALGSEDDLEVHAAVQANLTLVARGFVFQEYSIRHVGGGVWEVEANYGPRIPRGLLPPLGGSGGGENPGSQDDPTKLGPTDANGWTFDTTGGTGHITQSKTTVGRYGHKKEIDLGLGPILIQFQPPDVKGAINWTLDGVEGVDIVLPSFQFTETHYFAVSAITNSYIRDLMRLTGTVNFNYFREFEPGEVLFLGVTGAQRDQLTAELTFRFQVEPNEEHFEPTPGILVDSKKGHEYMWIRYEEEEITENLMSADGTQQTTRKTLVKRPTGVYVERVYNPGNFALLNIGA